MFEEQYKDLASAIDEIAERIRMLGSKAPGSWKTYAELTTIKDSNKNADSISMIHDLIDGQELIIKTLKKTIDEAQKIKDEVTIDMAVTRIVIHEKNSWMLKSSI